MTFYHYDCNFDYEPVGSGDCYNHAAYQVEIVQSTHDVWINFKTYADTDNGWMGRTYNNPTVSSMERLERVLNNGPLKVEIERDGKSYIIYATRRGG